VPGFRYRLTAVLEHFVEQHSRARRRHAEATAALEAELARLRELEAGASAAGDALRELGVADAGAFAAIDRQRVAASMAHDRQRERISRAQRATSEAREVLQLATRQKAAFEQHRARALQAARWREARAEAADLDECNALRHAAWQRSSLRSDSQRVAGGTPAKRSAI
jgi:hypothetical protein